MMHSSVPPTTVLFFAAFREKLGLSQLQLPLAAPTSVRQLLQTLSEQGPELQQILQQQEVLVAVDQQLVSVDAQVHPGAEVAIFPPVTGG